MAALDRPVGVERLLFLRSLSTSQPTGPEAVQIAGAMRDVHFKRGQELFALGAASGEVFFIVKGAVRMTAPGAPPWDFEAPAVVGAIDSFAGRARTRRGVATSETHALVLAHTDWLAVLEEHPDFARESALGLAASLGQVRLGVPGDGGYPALTVAEGAGGGASPGLDRFGRTRALRRLALFCDAGVEATLRLAQMAEEVALGAGDALFHEGEASSALHVVAGGVIEAARAAPPLSAAFGAGALVGGAAAMGLDAHPFTARARQVAVVLRLRRDDVLDVMEDHFALTRSLLGAINREREEVMSRHGWTEARRAGDGGGR